MDHGKMGQREKNATTRDAIAPTPAIAATSAKAAHVSTRRKMIDAKKIRRAEQVKSRKEHAARPIVQYLEVIVARW
jgi:hypothetical protein